MVANECLGKCVKVCLTDIRATKSQSIMEEDNGRMCFYYLDQLFELNRAWNDAKNIKNVF